MAKNVHKYTQTREFEKYGKMNLESNSLVVVYLYLRIFEIRNMMNQTHWFMYIYLRM